MSKVINIEKLSLEMNDTIIHREAVMRSGTYLTRYLISEGRNLDAIRLIGRCSVHDISKIQNTEEFMSLASIIEDLDQLHNIEYVLDEQQKDAIKLHHKNNRHHPEYYDNANDMTDLDILEMACDCHARSKQFKTDLLDYINAQQKIRFNFDKEHFYKLYCYCSALVTLSKEDDYSDIFEKSMKFKFSLKDSTLSSLERFDESCYLDSFKTERLFLVKANNSDFASVVYTIFLKEDDAEIGNISIKCDGTLEYKIYSNYLGNGYDIEAIQKIVSVSSLDEFNLSLKKDSKVDISDLGFIPYKTNETSLVYRLKKNNV
jgi:hypothetical protein